jgi:hypothetical protein
MVMTLKKSVYSMDSMPYIWCYKFGVVRNNIQRWGTIQWWDDYFAPRRGDILNQHILDLYI